MNVSHAKEAVLSAADIRHLVSYDPDTGSMKWVCSRSNKAPAGAEVGSINQSGYRYSVIRRKNFAVHRLVWLYVHGQWPRGFVDHINGIRSDNRLANLREATRSQNQANRRANSNHLKGTHFNLRLGRWQAAIRIQGKGTHLGYFDTAEAAHAAYVAKAQEVHGQFARAA
jgi:hypothetical protein